MRVVIFLILLTFGLLAFSKIGLRDGATAKPGDALEINTSQVAPYCGTGKRVALHLVTDSEDSFGKRAHPFAIRTLLQQGINYEKSGRTTSYWQEMTTAPAEVALFSPDHKTRFTVKSDALLHDSFPDIFSGKGLDATKDAVPALWVQQYSNKITNFKIAAIPCDTKVYVVATVWKCDKGYELRGFKSKDKEQKIIMKVEAAK